MKSKLTVKRSNEILLMAEEAVNSKKRFEFEIEGDIPREAFEKFARSEAAQLSVQINLNFNPGRVSGSIEGLAEQVNKLKRKFQEPDDFKTYLATELYNELEEMANNTIEKYHNENKAPPKPGELVATEFNIEAKVPDEAVRTFVFTQSGLMGLRAKLTYNASNNSWNAQMEGPIERIDEFRELVAHTSVLKEFIQLGKFTTYKKIVQFTINEEDMTLKDPQE